MSSSNVTDINSIKICAACDKEGDDLKACTACHMVKYCNRNCQIAHRPQHKKACKKQAAELYDEKLFAEPPPNEECPICFLPMPVNTDDSVFHPCCGKIICTGCIYALFRSEGKNICAFCRTPPTCSAEEEIELLNKLMDKGVGEAFYQLAGLYAMGMYGLPQDHQKANELFQKAGETGCALAYYNLGNSYYNGDGVEVNRKKAKHYWELAAMDGHVMARHDLGCVEGRSDNHHRAHKHYMIAAKAGDIDSLDYVKKGFMAGFVTKDEYTNTLRVHQQRLDEMKSDERDKAAERRNRNEN